MAGTIIRICARSLAARTICRMSFLAELGSRIRYGARMIAIDQTPDEVIIHYQTRSGRFEARGDYAIITVPFPVLRHVEVLKPFSRAKQRAIRQLHYDASAKIFFQTRSRFWEMDDDIFGGGTVTDLRHPQSVLHRLWQGNRSRHPAGQLYLVGGCAALGITSPA